MKGISFLLLLVGCATHEPDYSPLGKLGRQFEQCYNESDSIFKKPPVEGKIVYTFTAKPDGSLKELKIKESDFSKDRNFEACVTGQFRAYKYDPSPNGKEVDYIQRINFTAAKK